MATLKATINTQLHNLIPITTGSTLYKFIIRYYSLSNVLLTDTELTQNAEVTVAPTSNRFVLSFPIDDGDYEIENVKVRIYNNSVVSGCLYEFTTNLVVDCSGVVCSPVVNIAGTPTQTCLDDNSVTINGTSLSATGGNNTYQWAIIKEPDFTTTTALSWSSTKTWVVDHMFTYRIYVRDTSGNNSSTCYDYITITADNCGGDAPDGLLETSLYYSE